MTAFSDREHAIEAHFAARELATFRERARRYRRLGFRLAALLDLRGEAARRFAVQLSQQCIAEPSDENTYRRMANELGRLGFALSDDDVRHIALTGGGKIGPDAPVTPPPRRSWVEFVTTELLVLFTDKPTPALANAQQSHLASVL